MRISDWSSDVCSSDLFNPEVQLLANRGYAVLQMNYRGSGGYGSRFEFAGYRKWGTTMQDALTDSVRWAVAQGIADPTRTCIYGPSYRGYPDLTGVVLEPDLHRCSCCSLRTSAGRR